MGRSQIPRMELGPIREMRLIRAIDDIIFINFS